MGIIMSSVRRQSPLFWMLLLGGLAAMAGGYWLSAPAVGNDWALHKPAASGVNQRPLTRASFLAQFAATPEEHAWAQEAMHLGDNITDLSFDDALQRARQETSTVDPVVQAATDALLKDRQQLAQLKQSGAPPETIQVQKAQCDLDAARLRDVQGDALRAKGNPTGKVQRLLAEHEAAHHKADQEASQTSGIDTLHPRGLDSEIMAWRALRREAGLLDAAAHTTLSRIPTIEQRHVALHAEMQGALQQLSQLPEAERLRRTKELTAEQEQLSRFDQEIDLRKQLADTYHRWSSSLAQRETEVGRSVVQSFLWIVSIILLLLAINLILRRTLHHLHREQKRLMTLHHLSRFACEAVAAIGILMVLFGRPEQLATILGISGAGLMVAFQDPLLSIAGWFILIGGNGIAVGDWVEIDEVVGEVQEISLLRTTLLETGEVGGYTGRRVYFPNSFTLNGHYFNFSTSGQWLWDELELALPGGCDPRATAQQLQEVVQRETSGYLERAKQEWARVLKPETLGRMPLECSVQLHPSSSGLVISIRYLSPAQDRARIRAELRHVLAEDLERTAAAR